MKSAIIKINGRHFRYDYETAMVYWVQKATEEDIEDNLKWREQFGSDLFPIEDGWMLLDCVGLRRENWLNKEAREEYLTEWIAELGYESEILAEQYLAWG